jgi:hypothetical protein
MISRDELKALLDQLPESGFDTVESTIRFLLMQRMAEMRFRVAESPDAPPGRSAWSGESNGVCAAGYSFQQIGDGALLVQTLYSFDRHDIEITERISLGPDRTRLRCQLTLTSGGVTSLHDDEFPLNCEP